MGTRKESDEGAPSGRRASLARCASHWCSTCVTHSCVVDIYRSEATRRRECLYYLALGHYKMSNYDEAKKFNGECMMMRLSAVTPDTVRTPALLLEKEPSNLQAQSLSSLIEKAVARGQKLILLRKCPTDDTICLQKGTLGWPSLGVQLLWAPSSSRVSFVEQFATSDFSFHSDLTSGIT